MNDTKTRYLYVLLGALGGFLLGSSLPGNLSTLIDKLILLFAIIAFAALGRRIEASQHVQHMQDWGSIRVRGKRHFIFLHYLLLRGGMLAIVIFPPGIKAFASWSQSSAWFIFIAVLLAFMMIYIGSDEWNNCEREYAAEELRLAAEVEREATSLTN